MRFDIATSTNPEASSPTSNRGATAGSSTVVPGIQDCSVVICTRDRPQQLERCLQAVRACASCEVVVVDNAPVSADAQVVAARWGARYVLEPVPGLSRARNRGACEARGDIVIYLDDDAIPCAGWAEALAAEFADSRVMIVFGRVQPFAADDLSQALCELIGCGDPGAERKVIDRDLTDWFDRLNFSAVGIGANMAVRRSIFHLWPGFDERLGLGTSIPGQEENHLRFTLVAQGYRMVYSPASVVRHPDGTRSLDELRQRYLRVIESSAAYLMLLLTESKEYRGRTLRYILKKVAAVHPLYSRQHAGAYRRPVSRISLLIARLRGAWLYLRLRLPPAAHSCPRHA